MTNAFVILVIPGARHASIFSIQNVTAVPKVPTRFIRAHVKRVVQTITLKMISIEFVHLTLKSLRELRDLQMFKDAWMGISGIGDCKIALPVLTPA
jgi:hypothetical protein